MRDVRVGGRASTSGVFAQARDLSNDQSKMAVKGKHFLQFQTPKKSLVFGHVVVPRKQALNFGSYSTFRKVLSSLPGKTISLHPAVS